MKVSAGAKTEKVEEVEPGVFKIRVISPPEKGKAKDAVIKTPISKWAEVVCWEDLKKSYENI